MDTSILEEQRDQPAWMWVSRGWWSGLFQVIGYEKEKKRPGVEYFHVDNVGRLQGADADEPVRSHTAASA